MNGGIELIIIYGILAGVFYFAIYKPQKKEKRRVEEMLSSVTIGDNVLTSAGFYGVIIDMTDDTVIIEFGNNKNCRIPMQKRSIVEIEKPE